MSNELRGSRILLLGYGREGASAHRFLLKRYPQLTVGIADAQQISPIAEAPADTPLHLGPSYLEAIAQYDTIIHSPGIVFKTGPIAAALTSRQYVTSATNLFFEHAAGPIIGVTGTKGKSTTSSLIAAILSTEFADVRLAGNIGRPMLDYLDGATPQTTFVLELSSFQLEDLRSSPTISVILKIVPEHLDHHGSFEEYLASKGNIARFQKPEDIVVYNPEFSTSANVASSSNGRSILFTTNPAPAAATWLQEHSIVSQDRRSKDLVVDLQSVPLRGPGNVQNIMAAITVARHLNVPLQKIKAAIESFHPLEHRLEKVGTFKGITFINDSLSTNPSSLVNALLAYPDQIETVIAGGFDRGLEYTETGSPLASSKVKNLILFPTTGEKIWRALLAQGPTSISRIDVNSMEEAVQRAYELTSDGKICIMSPASSSFNMFRDYRERGDKFKEAVNKLGNPAE